MMITVTEVARRAGRDFGVIAVVVAIAAYRLFWAG